MLFKNLYEEKLTTAHGLNAPQIREDHKPPKKKSHSGQETSQANQGEKGQMLSRSIRHPISSAIA